MPWRCASACDPGSESSSSGGNAPGYDVLDLDLHQLDNIIFAIHSLSSISLTIPDCTKYHPTHLGTQREYDVGLFRRCGSGEYQGKSLLSIKNSRANS